MASESEEPPAKRLRSPYKVEDQEFRQVTLNMAKYDSSVRKSTDEQLVEIFELGLKVREAVKISLNPEAFKEVISPIHEEVEKIGKQFDAQGRKVEQDVSLAMQKLNNSVQSSSDSLSNMSKKVEQDASFVMESVKNSSESSSKILRDIGEKVVQNVSAEMNEVKNNMALSSQRLEDINTKLDQKSDMKTIEDSLRKISDHLEKPSNKGARAERKVSEILKENLHNFTVTNIARELGKGDIEVETPTNVRIMIEVKNKTRSITSEDIKKFEECLKEAPQFKVGILLSMESGIAKRAKDGRFEVIYNQDTKQYQVYVPNAGKAEQIIIWTVVMAEQLANIDGDIGDEKMQALQKMYEEFKENVEHSKRCRKNLESLETSVKDLKESLTPIIKSIEKLRREFPKVLG